MLTRCSIRLVSASSRCLRGQLRRNVATSSVLAQKVQAAGTDPIQQLFINKVKEYTDKSKSSGKLVDISPADEAALKDMVQKIERQYHATGQTMTEFPAFDFKDPASLQPVGLGVEVTDLQHHALPEVQVVPELSEEVQTEAYYEY